MFYKYVTENNLENIQTYMYSDYEGLDFLKAYFESRKNLFAHVETSIEEHCTKEESVLSPVAQRIKELLCAIKQDGYIPNRDEIDLFLKRFEVKKRIYRNYLGVTKVDEDSGYDEYETYIDLYQVFKISYQCTGNLKYLNAMIKLMDTLSSIWESFDSFQKKRMIEYAAFEMEAVRKLCRKKDILLEE